MDTAAGRWGLTTYAGEGDDDGDGEGNGGEQQPGGVDGDGEAAQQPGGVVTI